MIMPWTSHMRTGVQGAAYHHVQDAVIVVDGFFIRWTEQAQR